jgi:hypothetical protein
MYHSWRREEVETQSQIFKERYVQCSSFLPHQFDLTSLEKECNGAFHLQFLQPYLLFVSGARPGVLRSRTLVGGFAVTSIRTLVSEG